MKCLVNQSTRLSIKSSVTTAVATSHIGMPTERCIERRVLARVISRSGKMRLPPPILSGGFPKRLIDHGKRHRRLDTAAGKTTCDLWQHELLSRYWAFIEVSVLTRALAQTSRAQRILQPDMAHTIVAAVTPMFCETSFSNCLINSIAHCAGTLQAYIHIAQYVEGIKKCRCGRSRSQVGMPGTGV